MNIKSTLYCTKIVYILFKKKMSFTSGIHYVCDQYVHIHSQSVQVNYYLSLCMIKPKKSGSLTRSNTNQTVETKKIEISDLERIGTFSGVKTKALITCAVTVQLCLCFRVFVFAYTEYVGALMHRLT